jgi:hypothetical protein
MSNEFQTTILNLGEWNAFQDLLSGVDLEPITTGRLGGTLGLIQNGLVPLVRTTSRYTLSIQNMTKHHQRLLQHIQKIPPNECIYNNALIEVYGHQYRSMGYHSDQAQDLDEKSSICLFSCYNNPNTKSLRNLHIKNKSTGQQDVIILKHNSIVTFSVKTNAQFVHKIVLENADDDKTQWLGLTFRTSKTFIEFQDNTPYFSKTDRQLLLATKEQEKQFYKQRSLENATTDHVWPVLNYTLSPSDLLNPFVTKSDLFDIKVPYLDTIFETQNTSPRTKKFMYALLATTLHSEDEEHKGAL